MQKNLLFTVLLVVGLRLNHRAGTCLHRQVVVLAAWRCPVTTVVIVGTRTLGVQHLGVVVEEDGVLVSIGWGE